MENHPDTKKSSGMKTVDRVLMVAGVIGAVLVALWVLHAIVGLVLFFFKIAVLVVIVAVIARLFTRRRR
jgi:hypothetical protein